MARMPTENAHWRDSSRPAQFWIFDARATFPLVLFIFHIKMWTFVLAIIAMIFFALLNKYGFSIPVFWRWLRSTVAGKRREARPWWR